MSNRVQDSATSKEVEKYLDKYFYKEGVERVHDRQRQLKGIDVIYKKDYIDEKCATDYINKYLNTFAFEISSYDRNGNRYKGWLLNETLATTHYMICYINKCKVDKHPMCDDITEMETIYVSKKAITDYLESKGIDLLNLYSEAENLSTAGGLRIVRSKHKTESPTNILIPRMDLRRMGISLLT